MIVELQYLAWSVVLLLVHVVVQATVSDLSLGLGYVLGSQDDERMPDSPVAKRIERALMNFIETYPAFIALATIVAVTGTSNWWTATGAAVWFWARVAFVPAYASGIPVIRSLAWFASIGGLLMMLWPILFA